MTMQIKWKFADASKWGHGCTVCGYDNHSTACEGRDDDAQHRLVVCWRCLKRRLTPNATQRRLTDEKLREHAHFLESHAASKAAYIRSLIGQLDVPDATEGIERHYEEEEFDEWSLAELDRIEVEG
jgi:hypothetical protein